ncbi:MAG: hypothetical protein AAFW87_07710 [Pseudomonadota bacterium]
MKEFCFLFFAHLLVASPSIADAVCRLELQERPGLQLTATLTKTADAAAVEYDQKAGFLYPFSFACVPQGARLCISEKPWSLHAMSFEYPPYAITLSVLDRNAYGTAETELSIRLWRIVDCTGDLEFN